MFGLAALSVVIVDREGYLAGVQKSILRGAGVRRLSMVEGAAALQKDLILGRDAVLINWTEASDDFIDLIRAVRNKDTSPDPFVGIVLSASGLCRTRVRAAVDAGVSAFVSVPFRPSDMLRHIVRAAGPPEAFIDAPDYFGPDRRRKADPFYAGGERRTAQLPILEGDALASERARMRQTAMSALEVKVSFAH